MQRQTGTGIKLFMHEGGLKGGIRIKRHEAFIPGEEYSCEILQSKHTLAVYPVIFFGKILSVPEKEHFPG